MQKLRERVARRIRGRLNGGLEIVRIEDGLIFDHRNASHFVAEVNLRHNRITVPVVAEFRDHPDYGEDELVEKAMDVLEPRLRMYHRRGYRLRETDFQPGYKANGYADHPVPIFIALIDQTVDNDEELDAEIAWLLEQLPAK